MSHPTKESGELAEVEFRAANALRLADKAPHETRTFLQHDVPWLLQAVADRDALREAAQALVTARAEGARIEPWGALIAALERTK